MRPTQRKTRPTRTFWWNRARPIDTEVHPLRAVIFDADTALADIEREGHRVAFNVAFAAHGIDITWDVEEYGRLLQIPDGRRRIMTDLRSRGFGGRCGDLATQVYRTKTAVFDDCVLERGVTPRAGLIDLVMDLFVAGIWVGVVSPRRREWVRTLVRQLLGDGLVETLVTGDDLPQTQERRQQDVELYRLATWELGITPESALAVEGSGQGLRTAVAAGLPAVVVTTDYTAEQEFTGAAAVRTGYDGAEPLLAAGCRQLHRQWWITETPRRRSACG